MLQRSWGKAPSGQTITIHTISNAAGMTATLMNYGAIVLSLSVPGPSGTATDVALGYSNITNYYVNDPCFGSPIGRNANRIGGAAFTLDGTTYELEKNDGDNNLHSGSDRYNHRVWTVLSDEADSISFQLKSPDGDQGFPGNLTMTVTYTIAPDNTLIIDYSGLSDRKTVWNPTYHGYFNLRGQGNGDIDADYDLLQFAGGYDHNWILNRTDDLRESGLDGNGLTIYKNAVLHDPWSDRSVTVYSDMPGIQVYTGNYITNSFGKGGFSYARRSGIALETQYFPNALNIPSFEAPIIEGGKKAFHRTAYRFS